MRGTAHVRDLILRLTDPCEWVRIRENRQLEQMIGFRGQYESHRAFQMALLKQLGVRPSWRVLEIGCGTLTLGAPLAEHLDRGHYCGIDVRSSALDLAHLVVARRGLAGRNPRLLQSSTFGREELGQETFQLIIAFSMLYHLEDHLVESMFAEVAKRLRHDGGFVANVNVDVPSGRWLEFPFVQRSLDFYESIGRRHSLRMRILGRGADLGMDSRDLASGNYYLRFAGASSGDASESAGEVTA